MALDEQARNRIFSYCANTELGEEDTAKMMSYFLARDVEEPLTEDHLTSEFALTRLELREEMRCLRDDLRTELRTRLRGEMGELRHDMRQQFFWLMSTMLVVLGVLSTLILTGH